MEQLTEMDYGMLKMESSRTPNHITPVMFYDQSAVKGGKVRFKAILEVFERNLHKSAVFRRKLGGSTMGLDTPYWVEDPDFDLEFHVRHIALPKPGDWRQLCILLARLHARSLDMSRPLWEAYVIEGLNKVEGLPPNSFAIMLKVHHAAFDGVSAAEMLNAIHSPTDDPLPPPIEDNWRGEPDPSPLQVWTRAYRNNLRRPVKLIETLREVVPKMIRTGRDTPEERENTAGFKTRFNGHISSYRVMDAIILDLDRVKGIRQAVEDVTVNDVIVSVVGGGLRKYLKAKGELPQGGLKTAAPINVRAERNRDSRGNQVGMMWIKLGTDVQAPIERLQSVAESARESKEYASALGTRTIMDISQGLWPPVIGLGLRLTNLAAGSNVPLPMHTIVSNVPGPQVPLYLAGAKLHMLLGMGPLMDGLGLFHAVISGAGKISITFVSCRELMPDPEFYRKCLQEAWDELEAATRTKTAAKKRPKTRAGTAAEKRPTARARTTAKKRPKARPKSAAEKRPATRPGTTAKKRPTKDSRA